MFEGSLYGKTIFAKHISELKRKASRIANGYFNPVDKMEVKTPWGVFHYARFNKITPWNTAERGAWG